jgi:hypothetical protein
VIRLDTLKSSDGPLTVPTGEEFQIGLRNPTLGKKPQEWDPDSLVPESRWRAFAIARDNARRRHQIRIRIETR